MNNYRTGFGYDVHRFADNRPLVLGGVTIDYEMGLDGHSDADVILHAVCDAILGAAGQGDIGEHFPNTDPAFKDISSLILLTKVLEIIENKGFTVGNVDVMVVAEEPPLKDHKAQMKANIAEKLNISNDSVNIKATSNEQMGFIGRKEGIAAMASVLLEKRAS